LLALLTSLYILRTPTNQPETNQMRNNYYTVIWRDDADGDFCLMHIRDAKSSEDAINQWETTLDMTDVAVQPTGIYNADFDPFTLPVFIVRQGKVSDQEYREIVQREAAVNV